MSRAQKKEAEASFGNPSIGRGPMFPSGRNALFYLVQNFRSERSSFVKGCGSERYF